MEIDDKALALAATIEIEPNPFHPQNDQFNRENEQVKRLITAQQRQMTPKHVSVIKQHFMGRQNIQIAEDFNYTPQTVSGIINSDKGKRLHDLLRYLRDTQDGPSIAHRKAVLNRIMVRAEIKEPKVAITAIAEMNKMDVNQHNIENDGFGGTVNVTINQNYFPKTALDN